MEIRLSGPEAYRFKAMTAVLIGRRVLAGLHTTCFQTPALAYGAGLVEEIDGVRMTG